MDSIFNDYSKRYAGWQVRLEVNRENLVEQVQAHHVRLEGITADFKDNENTISISTVRIPDEHFTHRVNEPSRVVIERDTEDANEKILIASLEGETRIVLYPPLVHDEDGSNAD